MSRRQTLALPLGAALLMPLLLAGCGPKQDQFAPACPSPAFVGVAGDVSEFRPAANPGGGHDLTDLIVAGRIAGVGGKCEPGETGASVKTEARVRLVFSRGPAMVGRSIDVPYFLAVTEGDRILDKMVRVAHVTFPANVDQTSLVTDPLTMMLPVTPTKSAAAYSILVGFQLTQDQLDYNRKQQAVPGGQ